MAVADLAVLVLRERESRCVGDVRNAFGEILKHVRVEGGFDTIVWNRFFIADSYTYTDMMGIQLVQYNTCILF